MSEAFWLALPGILSAIVSAYVAWQNSKIRAGVEQVHKATNSMKDELVATTREAGQAEGRAQQRAVSENGP